MTKLRLKKEQRTIVLIIFVLICLIGLIYSLFNIINWKLDVDKNAKIQEMIDEKIKIIELNEEEQDIKYNIDFKALKDENKDTIAYLKVNGTNINYIVVKGKDYNYYLNHNFNKEYNIAGWIFADYHNKFDETDKNIIIYGHNTKDGSMFGTLKNILNKDWYEKKDNHKVVIVTEMGTYYYKVFSTYSIIPEDYYINTKFNNDSDFDNFVKNLKSRSIYDFGIEVSNDDKILTLSSCIGDGKKRVVLHAKLVKKI